MMMNREIRTIMRTNPVTTSPDQNVGELSLMMLRENIQQLPVVDNEELVGLVTVHDLWKQYENKTTIADLTVRDVMNTRVLKLAPKDKVGTAAELFADRRFKTLPVVNIDNKLKGVVTAFDLIKVAYNDEYAEPILYKEEFA